MNGDCNIFQEIKKLRGTGSTFSSRIDNEVGAENIANHFEGIYAELYNRVEHGDEFEEISSTIEDSVGDESLSELHRVNEDVVIEALKHMKNSKHDEYFTIASDCLINGPPELVTHLTNLIRLYLVHGTKLCHPLYLNATGEE